jgi:ADP-ribose pyrophosphatase
MAQDADSLAEETLDSRWGFEGRLVRVRVDRVLLPTGSQSTREVIVHPGAVAIVPVHADGTVVLVRQWRQAAGKALLEVPAGTLEAGEDPSDCAHRELAEEVCLAAGSMVRLFASYLAPGYSSELLHTFLATDLTPAEGQPDADELIEVVRLPLDRAREMVLAGEVEDAKTICGLLLAEHWWRAGTGAA